MKLSSSTLRGCCFCCYCHCWLMMLLMVSSVVHVSPEMSTSTTTMKKYTKLNNNPNYLSEMTEFIQLNRKIPNSTSRTVTTTLPPSAPAMSSKASKDKDDNDNKGNKVNNTRSISEHEMLTTIQTQSTMTSTTTATLPANTTKLSSVLPQHLKTSTEQQQHLYDTATSTNLLGSYKGSIEKVDEGVLYLYDNRIPSGSTLTSTTEAEAIATATPAAFDDNYVAANNVTKQQHQALLRIASTKPLVIARQKIVKAEPTTTTRTTSNTIQITKQDDYSKNRTTNRRHNKYWKEHVNTTSMESNANTRQQQQQHPTTSQSESSRKVFLKNPIESQKTTTGSINNNNSNNNSIYGTMNNNENNHLLNMKIQTVATATTSLKQVPTSMNSNRTTILSLNSRTSITSSSVDSRTTTSINTLNITNNEHNDNNMNNNMNNKSIDQENRTPTSRRIKDNNQSTDSPYKQQMPEMTTSLQMRTTATTTTASATYPTYSPMLQHNNQLKRPALLHRNARQITEDEQNEKCRMFIEGDPEKNELYSPDYPNDYPKNINCTRIITAPKGQIIRLDFRNSFHIEEKEECKFDSLEIRDGQYGFSNLIGKYCGTDFPPEITSKERYLWLHFHSDESIEYSGFTAVYEFIDRNRDAPSTDLNCTIEKDGYEGFINASDVPPEIKDTVIRNKIPLDCMWRIQVQEKWKIQVKFLEFKLAKPNDCETNFLDIFPEQTVMPLRVKNFCGSAGEGITSDSNILHMRFYAEQIAINSTFSILYTAFRDRGSSSCTDDEYDCEDATCISSGLKCNGRDNCKFRWDEEGCKPEDEGQSEHMIIIITVFGLILGGMVITFLVNCVRKIMHDQKIIRDVPVLSDGIYHIDSFILDAPKTAIFVGLHDDYKLRYNLAQDDVDKSESEHIRQSKESKLDEMGRNSKARSRDNLSIVSPRQKHSQTSLQILDDVSNRYYREMELQSKGNFKEKDPSILRHHDMIVQTSLCSTDDSSTTITEQQTPSGGGVGVGSGAACDMGCQTRESLFATASLMRQKSKTPSMAGSQRTMEGVPPPPRFSTFGYDAAQIAPPPPPVVSTLSRRNMHLPQEEMEMEQLPQQTTHVMMPHQQLQHQQQHQHLHHRPSQEICHHHHQHQQHLQQQLQQQQQQQKQTLPRHQQQQQQQLHNHQHLQQQQQQLHHHHHTAATTIPPNVTQLPPTTPGTSVVTAISTGSSVRPGGGGGGKNKQSKLDESKVFIDIRNSAPDVIIMTSH